MTARGWMGGLLALATATAARAEGNLSPLLEQMDGTDVPRSGILAVVGVGLMVLSVFARRRDP